CGARNSMKVLLMKRGRTLPSEGRDASRHAGRASVFVMGTAQWQAACRVLSCQHLRVARGTFVRRQVVVIVVVRVLVFLVPTGAGVADLFGRIVHGCCRLREIPDIGRVGRGVSATTGSLYGRPAP